VQPLPQRMLGHQRLQPTGKVRVLPSGQAQRNPLLDRREPQLIQLARLAPSPVIVDPGERGTAE
jgi:hypothetical protein